MSIIRITFGKTYHRAACAGEGTIMAQNQLPNVEIRNEQDTLPNPEVDT
jgi:hypothetical protein